MRHARPRAAARVDLANADAKPRVYAGLARCDPHMPILVLYDSRASEGGGNIGTDREFYSIVSSLLLSISEKGFPLSTRRSTRETWRCSSSASS